MLLKLIALNNDQKRDQHLGKEIICSAYGEYVVSTITDALRSLKLGEVPDLIKDEQLMSWYCPKCFQKLEKERSTCLDACQHLSVGAMREIGSVTPHPNRDSCSLTKDCMMARSLYVSFTVSLPVFDPDRDVYRQLAAIHSIGHLEDDIYRERVNAPPLVVYHTPTQTWKVPQMACCSEKGPQYICRCNVFETDTVLCGLQGEKAQNSSSSCLVRLTTWKTPMERVTYAGRNQFCVVTNQKRYQYGPLECPVTEPNFCFTPKQPTVIGNQVISPIPIFENITIIQSNPDYQNLTIQSTPTFLAYIPPLGLQLKSLMTRKETHLIQITNNMDEAQQVITQLINEGNEPATTSKEKFGLEVWIIIQGIGIVINFLMLGYMLYKCNKPKPKTRQRPRQTPRQSPKQMHRRAPSGDKDEYIYMVPIPDTYQNLPRYETKKGPTDIKS